MKFIAFVLIKRDLMILGKCWRCWKKSPYELITPSYTLMLSDDLDTFSIFSAIPSFVYQEIKVFTETDSGFSQTDKICNVGMITNFVLLYICNFLLNLQYMMLVNVKLYISGCNRITFQGCRLHWSSSFLMAQLKWSWPYWHSCIVNILWKLWNQNIPTVLIL